ncbi:MAG: hypothetical protein HYZ45_08465 [Burkholderiales bacterium]|nr:hypothetical protein [Burkholderiales bacterium]
MKLLKWIAGLSLSIMLVQPVLADPPGRAFRVAWLDGHLQVRNLQEDTRGEIGRNWTVGAGYALSTERFSKAELRVGSSIFRLDEESELEVWQLDDERVQLRLNYGTLNVQISNPALLNELSVETPQGQLQWQEVGRSRIQVWPRSNRSSLNVFSGKVSYSAAGSQMSVRAGHQIEIFGEDISTASASFTDFDRWGESRDIAQVVSTETLRYVSSEATGYEELDRQGTWQETTQYGTVWVPRARDWAPYRQGHWEWVSPWGWTWVDSTPWAYVTSHYGRWTWLDNRWCWLPGQNVHRPVWAPAYVGWVSNGQTVYAPTPSGNVAWFPLGPREAWVPWYTTSPQYVQRINQTYVPNFNSGHINHPNRYANSDRVIFARRDQFVQSGVLGAMQRAASQVPTSTPNNARPNNQPVVQFNTNTPVHNGTNQGAQPGRYASPANNQPVTQFNNNTPIQSGMSVNHPTGPARTNPPANSQPVVQFNSNTPVQNGGVLSQPTAPARNTPAAGTQPVVQFNSNVPVQNNAGNGGVLSQPPAPVHRPTAQTNNQPVVQFNSNAPVQPAQPVQPPQPNRHPPAQPQAVTTGSAPAANPAPARPQPANNAPVQAVVMTPPRNPAPASAPAAAPAAAPASGPAAAAVAAAVAERERKMREEEERNKNRDQAARPVAR